MLGVTLAVMADGAGAKVATVGYTLGLTTMYSVSAIYHRGHWSPETSTRLRRLDHTTILLAIAATYTPVVTIGVGGRVGWAVFIAVWTFALAGAVIRNVWLSAPRWATIAVYLVVGWVAVAAFPVLLNRLGGTTFGLIMLGGALYSAGAVVYSRKRPDPAPATFGYHEVFHALVVLAGLAFYAAVARVVT